MQIVDKIGHLEHSVSNIGTWQLPTSVTKQCFTNDIIYLGHVFITVWGDYTNVFMIECVVRKVLYSVKITVNSCFDLEE